MFSKLYVDVQVPIKCTTLLLHQILCADERRNLAPVFFRTYDEQLRRLKHQISGELTTGLVTSNVDKPMVILKFCVSIDRYSSKFYYSISIV